jgi:hypothetical protein
MERAAGTGNLFTVPRDEKTVLRLSHRAKAVVMLTLTFQVQKVTLNVFIN